MPSPGLCQGGECITIRVPLGVHEHAKYDTSLVPTDNPFHGRIFLTTITD